MLVSEASPHCRWVGMCESGLPSTSRRSVQIGSWWLTQTASWPSAASRARPGGGEHPRGDVRVRLAPGRPERVAQLRPGRRVRPGPVAGTERFALEGVLRLQQPVVQVHRQAQRRGQRRRGLLRALQRGGHEVGDVPVQQRLRRPLGHPPAGGGEVVAGQPAVHHVVRVVHLAVPEQVHRGRSSRPDPPRWRPRRRGRRPAGRRRSGPGRRRRARPRRTRPRTRTAAGRRRGPASRGRTPGSATPAAAGRRRSRGPRPR